MVVLNLGLSKHFGPKILYKQNWQNSQRIWTLSSLHAWLSVSTFSDIPITYIAYKTNQRIWVYQYWKIFIWRHGNILSPKNLTRKINKIHKDFWIIPSFRMHNSRHFVGCYTSGINSLLISFFTWFTLFEIIMLSQKSDINNMIW